MDLYDLLGNLQEIGFYDLLLPWALFFAITYGVLTVSGPFSTKKKGNEQNKYVDKSIPAIISMAVAFFAVNYIPYDMLFGEYLARMFGMGGTVIAGLLIAIILLGMAGINTDDKQLFSDNNKKYIAIAFVVITAIIYFGASNITAAFNLPYVADDTMITLLVIAGIAGAIYWITKK